MNDTRSTTRARAALQTLLNSLGLRHFEAAEILGVTTDTISHWETGSAAIPAKKVSEILSAKANARRLQTLLRPEVLPAAVRRPADIFAGESALQWILRGRIADVVDRYEDSLRYQA
jgi:DNA-binding transcriptional regulator YdaS (Cro superfamily)